MNNETSGADDASQNVAFELMKNVTSVTLLELSVMSHGLHPVSEHFTVLKVCVEVSFLEYSSLC